MSKRVEVEVYSEATNHWIVRTPGRQFPALVIQGDSLHGLYADLLHISDQLGAEPKIDAELREETVAIVESIRERLLDYERVITAAGFGLPYTHSVAQSQ